MERLSNSSEIIINSDFVAIDHMTTGLSTDKDEIIELAAVKVKGGNIIDRFHSFVKPVNEISNKIAELTGVTNDMVANADTIENVLPEFLDFVGNEVIVGLHTDFMLGFISRIAIEENISFECESIDIGPLAAWIWPGMKSNMLKPMIEMCNLELEEGYNCTDCAMVVAEIYLNMIEHVRKRGVNSFHEYILNMLYQANENAIIEIVKASRDIGSLTGLYERGYIVSFRWLADCYFWGIGRKKDIKKAQKLYFEGMLFGFDRSTQEYCREQFSKLYLESGNKRIPDNKYAKVIEKICKREAEEGYGDTPCLSDMCVYLAGEILNNNFSDYSAQCAFAILKNNNTQDDFSLFYLGECYYHGVGVEKDKVIAEWMFKLVQHDFSFFAGMKDGQTKDKYFSKCLYRYEDYIEASEKLRGYLEEIEIWKSGLPTETW